MKKLTKQETLDLLIQLNKDCEKLYDMWCAMVAQLPRK